MFKYILVMLDNQSSSFCYYNNDSKKEFLMPFETLEEIIEYASGNQTAINFLYSEKKLPKKYADLIEKSAHIKYLPLSLYKEYEDKVIILESDDKRIDSLEYKADNNIILRLKKSDLSGLSKKIILLIGKCKRINLLLLDIPSYTQADMDLYEKELDRSSGLIAEQYKKGNAVELSFLSDRFFLDRMNNCNAGVDHITFAPNGKFYICPGFYFDDVADSIGDITSGINIKNQQLFDLEHAPVCSVCDAYHCKRCVWLNKKTTLEVNTPSLQQCSLSHIERDASRKLLERLKSEPGLRDFNNLIPIPEVDYIDPMQVLKRNAKGAKQILEELTFAKNNIGKNNKVQNNSLNRMSFNEIDFDNMTTKDLLIDIYKMQRIILRELNINGGNKNGSN